MKPWTLPKQMKYWKNAGVKSKWLPDQDLNLDKQIQNLLCYRYTIGQCRREKTKLSEI